MENATATRNDTEINVGPRDPDVARWIFKSLKPLRAACVENDYTFMAYLIEMSEVEAYRMMRNNQVSPSGNTQ